MNSKWREIHKNINRIPRSYFEWVGYLYALWTLLYLLTNYFFWLWQILIYTFQNKMHTIKCNITFKSLRMLILSKPFWLIFFSFFNTQILFNFICSWLNLLKVLKINFYLSLFKQQKLLQFKIFTIS